MDEKLSAIDTRIDYEKKKIERIHQKIEALTRQRNTLLALQMKNMMDELNVQSAAELFELMRHVKGVPEDSDEGGIEDVE